MKVKEASNKPAATRPVSDDEKMLREKFYENITTQNDLLDKLSERLLTLELSIPGLYVTAVKLISGDKATVAVDAALYVTFACWLLALILTLMALTPRKWIVDLALLRQDPKKVSEALGIEDFFEQSALYKRRLLTTSSVLFFVGIFSAVFTIG